LFKQLAVAGLRRGFGAVKALRSRYTRRRRMRTRSLLRLTRGFVARSRYGHHLGMSQHAHTPQHARAPKTRRVFWGFEPRHMRPSQNPALAKLSNKPVNRAARYSGKYGPPPRPLARRKSLEVRVAETEAEVRAAQRLRYQVFYEEMSAQASPRMAAERRDFDDFDAFADHLLVIDHSRIPEDYSGRGVPEDAIVGTYRLMRQEVAEAHGGFYTANEFDIEPWVTAAGPDTRFLELGRSCVHIDHRSRPTLELMWHAIISYLVHYELDIMFGCASLEGTNPDELALPLSFMHHYCRGDVETTPPVRARDELFVDMNRIPKEDVEAKKGLRALPPLIKGYLRAGATIGDGAVVDEQFGTTDVLIVFPANQISDRYRDKFGKGDMRSDGVRADSSQANTPASL
jgi:putative hemolysin